MRWGFSREEVSREKDAGEDAGVRERKLETIPILKVSTNSMERKKYKIVYY